MITFADVSALASRSISEIAGSRAATEQLLDLTIEVLQVRGAGFTYDQESELLDALRIDPDGHCSHMDD